MNRLVGPGQQAAQCVEKAPVGEARGHPLKAPGAEAGIDSPPGYPLRCGSS